MSNASLPRQPALRWGVPGICLLLAAITFAVFGQTLHHEFIDFDDGGYVYENPVVTGGLSLKGFAWVFTHADCHFYHPLTMLSLMADYQLHGLHAGGYLFTNVLLHTASVILLFLVLRQMTGALWRSAFVAAVFAIHPLRVESVAWVAERKDVLGAFFFMLTLAAYVRYVYKPDSLARYLMVAAAFVLSLLSKPIAMTLPFLLLLLDYWPLQRVQSARRLVLEKIPLLALAMVAGVVTVRAEGIAVIPFASVPMPSRIGNAVVSYAVYLRQMFWPEGLAPFYLQQAKGYPAWITTLSFLLLALITGGVVALRRKHRWLLTGWLWYLGMLAPMIGIIQVGGFAHADRMTYLPQIGIYMALTWLAAEWAAKWHVDRVVTGGLMVAAVGTLMICAGIQTAYWKNDETLWAHTLACTTGNYIAHGNLGNAFLRKGRVDDAITQFQEALQIKPDEAMACYNLGNALLQKGRTDEAIVQYQTALRIEPDYEEAHGNLGNVLLQKGRVDEAIAQYQEMLQNKPDDARAHYNLGNALLQKGKTDDAIGHYKTALEIKPLDVAIHLKLGNLLLRKGRVDEAIDHFQNALQIKPDFAEAHDSLGNALLQKGSVTEAITQYQKALQIEPANPRFQNNLAWLLATCPQASLRDGNKAVELARRANGLADGKNTMFLDTLAAAYAEAGRFSEAVETAQSALRLAEAQSNTNLAGTLQSEMKLYQAGRPFHSP